MTETVFCEKCNLYVLDTEGCEHLRPDAAVKALVEAAREFVRKVEAGEARSTRSYSACKAALSELDTLAANGVKS